MSLAEQTLCVVIVHSPGDGLGVLAEVLLRHRVACRFWYPPAEPEPPLKPSDLSLVVSLGGAQHPGDPAHRAWQDREAAFLTAAIDSGKAVLAICLGAQILAGALGGRLGALARPEIGLVPLGSLARTGPLAPLCADGARVYQWHSYGFACPPGAEPLAVSDAVFETGGHVCQAFRCGARVLGVQFHLELTRELMFGWLGEDPQDPALIARVGAEIDRHGARTEAACASAFDRWLTGALDGSSK